MPLNVMYSEVLVPAVDVTIVLTDSPQKGGCDGDLMVKHAHLSCLNILNAFEKCILDFANS